MESFSLSEIPSRHYETLPSISSQTKHALQQYKERNSQNGLCVEIEAKKEQTHNSLELVNDSDKQTKKHKRKKKHKDINSLNAVQFIEDNTDGQWDHIKIDNKLGNIIKSYVDYKIRITLKKNRQKKIKNEPHISSINSDCRVIDATTTTTTTTTTSIDLNVHTPISKNNNNNSDCDSASSDSNDYHWPICWIRFDDMLTFVNKKIQTNDPICIKKRDLIAVYAIVENTAKGYNYNIKHKTIVYDTEGNTVINADMMCTNKSHIMLCYVHKTIIDVKLIKSNSSSPRFKPRTKIKFKASSVPSLPVTSRAIDENIDKAHSAPTTARYGNGFTLTNRMHSTQSSSSDSTTPRSFIRTSTKNNTEKSNNTNNISILPEHPIIKTQKRRTFLIKRVSEYGTSSSCDKARQDRSSKQPQSSSNPYI